MDALGEPNSDKSITVTTRITAVAVYPNQALVTRQGNVELTGQERKILISELPPALKPQSLRIGGQGTAQVEILGLQVHPQTTTEAQTQRVATLAALIHELEDKYRHSKDVLASLQMQRSFIEGLSEQTMRTFSRGLAQQQVGLPETQALVTYCGEQHQTLLVKIAQEERVKQTLDHQLQEARQHLQEFQSQPKALTYDIQVLVQVDVPGSFEFELTYSVDQASWVPLYDGRLNLNSTTLQLTYLASVQQTSGEDWAGVALTLSTSRPESGPAPPRLNPWYVDIPKRFAGQGSGSKSSNSSRSSDPLMDAYRMLGALPGSEVVNVDQSDLNPASGEFRALDGVISFTIPHPSTIPCDGAAHRVVMDDLQFPCQLAYIGITQRFSHPYLQVTVVNPMDGLPLLPGQVNLFQGHLFVGTTDLQHVIPGQTFNLNLGIDERLSIRRELTKHEVEVGQVTQTVLAYQLVVFNPLTHDVDLTIIEQIPISRNEAIHTYLVKASPQTTLSASGQCEWQISLPPQTQATLSYEFAVDYPSGVALAGFDF